MSNEIRDGLMNNVTRYDDIQEYGKYNAGATTEDLQELIYNGWIAELTPGTYNGALDKFDRVTKLTDNDIIGAIKLNIAEDDTIMETIESFYSGDSTSDMQALAYTEIYDVFTIGQRLYVDMDK
ncbi:hypothetical protein HOU39_gp112 [Lactobacillus phage Iacchus]|uniref:Uncharacterized protein n=1 Tax=Lactobacillus phage Iacchus TaxID=2315483 RepID=A0A3Q8HY80_9CAUD|nr:hypothetical protein HOU39_gp112 [Lactobacillus phage Iacchus]AYH92006.1 hypothetical protein [Lactobacillus phage Iacchus]AYH92178.1 hypothetical protein [Lactobacillus phage Dionysus]